MGSRSNKPLTQFACNHLVRSMSGIGSSYKEERGNTTVVFTKEPTEQVFQVFLCNQLIFKIITAKVVGETVKVVSMEFGIGQTLDSVGNPRKTTVERLNGLLDRLGDFKLVPENVRVFYLPEEKCYAIGKGEDYVTLGASRSVGVMLRPNASYFEPIMRIEGKKHS